jgi:hypothetical protein
MNEQGKYYYEWESDFYNFLSSPLGGINAHSRTNYMSWLKFLSRQHPISSALDDVAIERIIEEERSLLSSRNKYNTPRDLTNFRSALRKFRQFILADYQKMQEASLQEEVKRVKNDMTIDETDEMGFWNKMKEVLAEAFGKKEEEVQQTEPNVIESTNIDLEEQTPPTPEPVVETPQEQPKVEEPTTVPQEPKETTVEPENKPQDAPKPQDNHLEELVNSLKEEIEALKEMNTGLQDKIKDLGKQPSASPINTNAKPSAADTYSAWREKMRGML